jgi:sugar phosphate isomerase/epimerase
VVNLSGIKIGAQLIIWGKIAPNALINVLDEAASSGYEGIEAGPIQFENTPELKRILASRRLSLVGLHLNVAIVNRKIVDDSLMLLEKSDSHYLLFSGAAGKANSDEDYLRNSKTLEEIGKKAMNRGIRVCYHNHWQEIINNARGIRLICENTSPKHVSLCVDTYWVKCGGMDPAEFIKANSERVSYLHLKDGTEEQIKNHQFTELGQGIIDFPAIMNAIEPLEIEWAVVEQDTTTRTPRESMAISRKYLRENLGL